METKSGAQKLSDFGSELGQSHTATRLDGESMQGENTAQLLGVEKKAKQAMGIMLGLGGLHLVAGLAIMFGLFASGGGTSDAVQMLLVGGSLLGLAVWTRRDSFSGSLAGFTMYVGYNVLSMVLSGTFDMRSSSFKIAIAGALAFAARESYLLLVNNGRRPQLVKPLGVGFGLLVLCYAGAMLSAPTATNIANPPDVVDDDVDPTEATTETPDVPAKVAPAKTKSAKSETVKTEPAKADPTKAEPAKSATTKAKVVAPVAAKPVKGAKAATTKTAAPAKGKPAKATTAAKAAKAAKPAKPAKAAAAKTAAKPAKGKVVAKAPAKGATKAKAKKKPH